MRKLTLLTCAALLLGSSPAWADWSVQWKDGFRVDNDEAGHSLKFGGRIQADFAAYDEDDSLSGLGFEDGSEFRRARLFFSGTLYDKIEFKAQYDFADGSAAEPKDLYIGFLDLGPLDVLRVGHFKEPFSLEELTSSKYVTFMERALPVEAFSPARNTGVMVGSGADRWTWAAGAFHDSDDSAASTGDEINLSGRVTFLPFFDEDSGSLFHVGLSATDRSSNSDSLRFRSRPESHLSPRVVDTGTFGGDGYQALDLELAFVAGRFSAQSEYIQATTDGVGGGDPDFDSFYVYGSFFLTDDHRSYDAGDGAFGRTKPSNPWGPDGSGAWELAVRYSTLDLTDAGILGGEVDDITLALNWYPYSNVRWMLNYVLSDVDDNLGGGGDANVIQTRFQIDF
jgi:phosphate-selective porin OprO and OprP